MKTNRYIRKVVDLSKQIGFKCKYIQNFRKICDEDFIFSHLICLKNIYCNSLTNALSQIKNPLQVTLPEKYTYNSKRLSQIIVPRL